MTDSPKPWDGLIDHLRNHIMAAQEEAFNLGWEKHRQEVERQAQNPDHPITRSNPFTKPPSIPLYHADGTPLTNDEIYAAIAAYQKDHPNA